jgi:ADP-L-glycero-D-manno-heptose 6-epimerase
MIWMFQKGTQSGVFNLGSGKARSFAELAHAVFEALGKEAHLQFIDMPAHLQGRYQYFTEARPDRLRAAGWRRSNTSLEDGVRAYVRTYLSQEDPYR